VRENRLIVAAADWAAGKAGQPMRSYAGALVMTALGVAGAQASGDPPFLGKWRIVEVRGADAFDTSKTMFEVAADGRVATTVGCNRIVCMPTVDRDRMTFGAMAATRMACPPPLDALETKYAAALEAARTWRAEGTKLLILDGNGETAVTLERAD
jgi:heat shock protein HslJ